MFILFVAMVNGIDSLISLSDFLLLMDRNARDFCVIILYPETLLELINEFGSFLVALLRFYLCNIMLSANSSHCSLKKKKIRPFLVLQFSSVGSSIKPAQGNLCHGPYSLFSHSVVSGSL